MSSIEFVGSAAPPRARRGRIAARVALIAAALVVVAVLIWQGLTAAGNPDPTAARADSPAAVLDIGVLVFREGLECILVLAAITAGRASSGNSGAPISAHLPYQRPIAVGAGIGFVATLITWQIVVGIIDNLTESIPALQVQAATGLLAIVVLIVVMNWFFHKLYWTGWIAMHNKKKRELLKGATAPATPDAASKSVSRAQLLWGLGLLGFSSLYREGFEVVLFLQNYRLKLGGTPVLYGVLFGLLFSGIVAVLTFIAHRRLPYRKMLVLTGVLLGVVLLVMVGEQAQEMQLAHWLPTTPIHWLVGAIPAWMGLWFAVFPTIETLTAQSIAALLVLGSYFIVRLQILQRTRASAAAERSVGIE